MSWLAKCGWLALRLPGRSLFVKMENPATSFGESKKHQPRVSPSAVPAVLIGPQTILSLKVKLLHPI
jgi:hypothetical protein